ncbi:lysophospholipid acyltransferase family protein [Thalassotalea euphylliae]|uniref:L-ornithine N(alpha)-acyltransferase n=1 Tax=Thalassotalea euphylliae TaxID=1655234 RepID=A0A3E0UBC1_9GAMM|nr:GNAT family N-acyltransferase [Thalassotalea euphylliae]REL34226.1 GNAT family N-acetyltransferase [Thalassotalea euphylliae]
MSAKHTLVNNNLKQTDSRYHLSIRNVIANKGWLKPVYWFAPLLDRLVGLKQLDKMYQRHEFQGLNKAEFTEKFIDTFELELQVPDGSLERLPKTGPAIVVANHAFGGIEGVALAHLLNKVRPDVQILANRGLSIFPELAPYFIFTNPLKSNAKGNSQSLKACLKHLKNDGMVVLFPAGRVSYPKDKHSPVSDHEWHRMVAMLAKKCQCPVLPVHISGQNRPIFYRLGLIYFRFRLLMLIREMIHSQGKKIPITIGKAINNMTHKALNNKSDQHITDLTRLLTYLQDPELVQHWPERVNPEMQPIAPAISPDLLNEEVTQLPESQQLASFKTLSTYYAKRTQVPNVIEEIRRLREENFRLVDEGSGAPQDGDDFDDSYVHLFIFDHQTKQVVGAYRMGQSDKLLAEQDAGGIYLAKMFNFNSEFINQQSPCLEMGRSFLIAEQQKSFHGLLLLFKGIGAFAKQFPQYRTLYGTVSLSTQYQPLSVMLIDQFLVKPEYRQGVAAKKPFQHQIPYELSQYLAQYGSDIDVLDWLVSQIEPDGKGLPVLVKQYHQLGAKFHCVGIDPNFANTPGLLLSVHLPDTPEKLLKLYLGKDYKEYLDFRK